MTAVFLPLKEEVLIGDFLSSLSFQLKRPRFPMHCTHHNYVLPRLVQKSQIQSCNSLPLPLPAFASASVCPLPFLGSHPTLRKDPVLCAPCPCEACPCCFVSSSPQRGGCTQKHKPHVKSCPTTSDRHAGSREGCCHFRQCHLSGNSLCICCVVSAEGQLLSSPFSMASHMLCVAFPLFPPKSVGITPYQQQTLACGGWGL